MSEEIQIPTGLRERHGSHYRSFPAIPMPPGAVESVFGIGFLQKSGQGASNVDACPGHYSAIYVLAGRGTYRDSTGATGAIVPGTVFQRLTDRKHSTTFDHAVPYQEVFLAFAPWLLDPVTRMLGLAQRPVVQVGIDLVLIRDLATTADALPTAAERDLPRLYLHCLGLLTALFSRARPSGAGDDTAIDWIDDACALLAQEATARLPLERIAKRLGLGYETFRKEFRERMGVSPGDYRIRRRIDRARELLVNTADPVGAIADALGYPNPSVFSLQFKREVGISPEHYRRRGS
jgi:AraC-like DNA-binding protein